MFRAVLYVVLFGTLLREAKSDFNCFADKMKGLESRINLFFGENKELNCRTGREKLIDALQHAIDQCSVPVSTNSMKVLLDEICEPRSELYKTLEERGTCMAMAMKSPINVVCGQPVDSSLSMKERCLKFKKDYLTCYAESVGGPCGERAVKAMKRILKTSDALTKGVCDELASSSSYSLTTVARTLRWVALAVTVFIGFLLLMKKCSRKSPSNQSTCEAV